jgi:hypothetical protein
MPFSFSPIKVFFEKSEMKALLQRVQQLWLANILQIPR